MSLRAEKTMIDFHTHILPGVDDGAKGVEESLALLNMLADQGVTTAFATPHFIPSRSETPERFLHRRTTALERLPKDLPIELLVGAELTYYPGISRMSSLLDLRLQGTRILLLEMPAERWSDYTVGELTELTHSSNILLMLAHIERFIGYQKGNVIDSLVASGVIMQSNASFFAERKTQSKAIKLLKRGWISVLGSDCHNLDFRAPRLDLAAAAIEKRLGAEYLDMISALSNKIVKKTVNKTVQSI